MSLLNATTPPSERQQEKHPVEYGLEEENDVERKDYIRKRMSERVAVTKWGFSIVRCTYSSQSRWDKYLRRIHSDIDRFLNYKEDAGLRETLNVFVIENEALDGATWKQARDKFDEWVWDELKNREDFSDSWKEPGNKSCPLQFQTRRAGNFLSLRIKLPLLALWIVASSFAIYIRLEPTISH